MDDRKKFPKDCDRNCPHYHAWDMSVDDWTNACDLLKVQIDDCDMDFQWMYCPLKEENEPKFTHYAVGGVIHGSSATNN